MGSRRHPFLCLLVSAAFTLCAAAARAEDVRPDDAQGHVLRERALRTQLALLDSDLVRLQRNTRVYLGGWVAVNTALCAAQLGIALSTHSEVVRSNYFVGAGLSAAGLALLVAEPWSGSVAHTRFAALPEGDTRQVVDKLAHGERLLHKQRRWDVRAITPLKHVLAVTVAAVSGVRAGLSFDSVAQGFARAGFVLGVLEAQILTRPSHYFAPDSERGVPAVALAPLLGKHVLGARVQAAF